MTIHATAVVVGLMAVLVGQSAPPSELSGRVVFAGLGVPGATVSVVKSLDPARDRGERGITTLSNDEGAFRLANLESGVWKLHVEMRGFVPIDRDVTVPFAEPSLSFELKMRPYEDIVAAAGAPKLAGSPDPPLKAADDPDIINGTQTNGAATPFSQSRAVGNNRPRGIRLYNGNVTTALANSAWNARPYTFGGPSVPANTNDVQVNFTLGGPLRIPWLIKYGPNMTLGLQHGVTNNATTQSALMPTAGQRLGDFSQSAAVIDPLTGLPFSGNVIPADRISPQAAALLGYYPLPNASTTTGANFQRPIVATTKQDGVRFSTNKALTRRDAIQGAISFQRNVGDTVNLFDFTDERRQLSLDTSANWTHTYSTRFQIRSQYQFTRAGTTLTPFFAGRVNVAGDAGIGGNEQSAVNWGPPTIALPAIAGLGDAQYQRSTTLTHAAGIEARWRRGRHNVTFGGDITQTALDVSSQPDPRGTLSFTGQATGDAFADFLLGLPTTSSLSFSNSATKLRGRSYDGYVNDDFRLAAGITLTLGVRWEYEAPYTEAAGRLANFDVAPGFAAVTPVTGNALLRPDRHGLEPRVAASWRPRLGSTLVIHASYGLARNLGVYQSVAQLLAQQPPFARTFSVQTTAAAPLTLTNPFPASLPTNSNTFAIDPGFRAALAHSWQVTAQREFPASMTVIGGYFGDKGTHLMQAFLPNTYPAGAPNPCASCPSGFVYVTSGGESIRHALQLTVRRRLHSGFTASAQYTLAKAEDDAATFNNRGITPASLAIAQDWLNLGAERGPSSFDQRHLVSVQVQYTSGMGLTGGSLVNGVKGSFFKGWTIEGRLNAGSGLPFTPVSFVAVGGTGFVGVRPSLTGISPAPVAPGSYANAAAYSAPLPGTWGDAGRNSIRGPAQFSLDLSLMRTFTFPHRMRIDWRVNVTNLLNRVTFSTINTTVTSPQFGLPTGANGMRRIQTSFLFGF